MSVFLNLVGCLFSPLLSFTFPAIFYLKLIPDIPKWKKIFLMYFMVITMIIVGLYGLLDFIFNISIKIYS